MYRKPNQFELNSLVVQIIVTYYLLQEILYFAKMFYLDFELLIKRKTPQKRHVFLSLISNSRRYLSINLCLKNLAVPLLTVVHPIFQEMKSLKYSWLISTAITIQIEPHWVCFSMPHGFQTRKIGGLSENS